MLRAADLFAGGGGFTEGAKLAGAQVLWASNHWTKAVEVHSLRHPDVEHSCQDLNQADFSKMPDHELLLASPACQGHSHAGNVARAAWGLKFNPHDTSRSTAWAVISAAEAKRPEWVLVENVPRFSQWQLFSVWRSALVELGYSIETMILDAADFGAPQNRKRLFIVGRLGRAPELAGRFVEPARGAAQRSSWAQMRSILDVEGGSGWAPVKSKSAKVRERVERSRARHGSVFLTQHVRDHFGRSLAQPLPTITCGDQMAIVRDDEMRPLSVAEYLAGQGFARDYLDGIGMTRREAVRIVGNAVAVPVARALVEAICSAGFH